MTQEQKDLLLRDLSSRLPYGLKLGFYAEATKETYTCTLLGLEPENDKPIIAKTDHGSFYVLADHVKPYLFPMSSMTIEQEKEYRSIIYKHIELHPERYYDIIDVDEFDCLMDFYNKYHLDYRGLIKLELANDATGLNIY